MLRLFNCRRNILNYCRRTFSLFSEDKHVNFSTQSAEKINDIQFPQIPDLPSIDVSANLSFSELGLNNYTPPGFIQFLFENIHHTLDVPFWTCIVSTILILRISTTPVTIIQRQEMYKMLTSSVGNQQILIEILDAKENNDVTLMSAKFKEYTNKIQTIDVDYKKLVLTFVIQAFTFMSVFIAMQGISNAPIKGLDTGGTLWFSNLSAIDPTYMLPLIASVSTLIIFLKEPTLRSNATSSTMKFVCLAMPFLMFAIICNFPAAMCLTWAVSNLYTLIFSILCDFPKIRKAFGIPTIESKPVHNPKGYSMQDIMKIQKDLYNFQITQMSEEKRWDKEKQRQIYETAMEELKKKRK